MEIWKKGAKIELDLPEGGEFLVLDGSFNEDGEVLRKHSWLRVPEGGKLNAIAQTDDTKVWMKLRHIPYAAAPTV